MYKSYKKPFIKLITFLGKRIEAKRLTKPPIYLGGCGRSGTTLLLSILSSHPEIFACRKELNMYNKVVQGENGISIPKRIDRLYRNLLVNKIRKYCNRWCEKTPSNVLYIKEINSYHNGNFRFIHIVRDGRDVILSKHPTSPETYWVSPERWINNVTAGFKEKDNPKVHTVRYEDLILNYEREIKKICDFLEIPFCEEIKNWHDHATVRENRAYFGEVKNIFSSSVAKWRKPENAARVQELLKSDEAKKLLAFYGYEI